MTSNLAYNISLDDGNPQFVYSVGWHVDQQHSVAPGNPSGATETNFFNGSIHVTGTNGSSASLVFTGTAIYYFGDVDSTGDHGLTTITLDGENTIISSYDPGGYRGQVMLFSQTGLANTTHSLIITDTDAAGILTTVDRIIYTAEYPNPDNSSTSTASSPRSNSLPSGTLAAIIICSAIAGMLLLGLLLFLRRRRRREHAKGDVVELNMQFDEHVDHRDPIVTPYLHSPSNDLLIGGPSELPEYTETPAQLSPAQLPHHSGDSSTGKRGRRSPS